MTRNEIKKIVMSVRTAENENIVNKILAKIDLMKDEELDGIIAKIGDNADSIKKFILLKVQESQENRHIEQTPINALFAYGISGNCIHLHLPVNLRPILAKNGVRRTFDLVNLHLLDAIEKIRKMQQEGFYKFQDKDIIYMISPALIGNELKYLNGLDFKTKIYMKKELQNKQFVQEHTEAQLATYLFGDELNVGAAKIGLDVVNSEEWQEKRKAQLKIFEQKGIKLGEQIREDK